MDEMKILKFGTVNKERWEAKTEQQGSGGGGGGFKGKSQKGENGV
jgi:hypothetical protein